MERLAWLEQTDLSIWMRESDWGFPIMLCFHAVGMGLVVGISFMFSARVLGYARDFPLAAFERLFGIAWLGFAMNAVSGVLLFIGEPRRLLLTPAFLIKLALIVFAGFSVWFLMTALQRAKPRRRRRWSAARARRDPKREDRRDHSHCVLGRRDRRRPAHRIHDRTAAGIGGQQRRRAQDRHQVTEAEILHWIKATALGAAVRDSTWLFWAGQSLHFVGLSLLLGGMLIVDLRLLGFIRRVPVKAALAFLPLALVGFLINLATGIEFFTMDPFMYWPNPAFRLKMLLILLAGLNALVFTIMEYRHALTLGEDESPGAVAKVTAGLSLGLWLGVLLLGRLLPSFEGSTGFF